MSVDLNQLPPTSSKKRTRIGRGRGSGMGKTAGRGTKGQKARSGGGVRPGFEGGHTPLYRLLPKLRGFTSHFRKPVALNVGLLAKHFKDGDTVSTKSLAAMGLISKSVSQIKILGEGEIAKKLKIFAVSASKSAQEKIKRAGGSITLLGARSGTKETTAKDKKDKKDS